MKTKKEKPAPKTVVISRKRWCRGGSRFSALRTKSGQSCCLGFVARAFGLKTPTGSTSLSDLTKDQDVSVLPKRLRPTRDKDTLHYWNDTKLHELHYWNDTKLHEQLVDANDDCMKLKGMAREERIAELLLKADVVAVFVD